MNTQIFDVGLPFPDLIFGATLYFPPIFKAFLLGTFLWLILHYSLRNWIYSGKIWHPTLMDLSIFVLCIFLSLFVLVQWS